MDLIIENGRIVNVSGVTQADIGVIDGRIAQIGGVMPPARERIDAAGCLVLPGGIDVHTHLDIVQFGSPSADNFTSGTIAAACGGTTTVLDFCAQEPGQSLADAIAAWDAKAVGKSAVDFGYHIILTDLTDAVLAELATLPGRGITTFKVFMAYRGMVMQDDLALIRTLKVARDTGAMVMIHAENGDAADYLRDMLVAEGKTAPYYHAVSRPPRIEAEATARAIALCEIVGSSIYIVHVSCDEALEEVMRGKARGVDVIAETCTQYLYTTIDDLKRPDGEGAKFVFTPPPRTARDQDRLWKALADRQLETVSSDHCSWPFNPNKLAGKDDFRKIPNGSPGVEERLMMVYQGVNEGRITLTEFVDIVSTRPAKQFGLFPRKGTIAVGSDADLVIWDPEATLTIGKAAMHGNADYCTYEGQAVKGMPRTVLLRGQVIVNDREYVGTTGLGQFLKRSARKPLS